MASASKEGQFTYYESYPRCCCGQDIDGKPTPISPNCDPKAPKDECDDYSGCKYMGDLAAYGHKSFDWVQSHNIVSFYDDSDPNNKNWDNNYAKKTIRIDKTYNGKFYSFNATIADQCGNGDCDNCCSKNSRPSGYLIDMEYYTVLNNFGTLDAVGGTLEFHIYN
jgi:hypothetical protein